MQLILSVQNTDILVGSTSPMHTFTVEGGTIGRADQATWQVADKPNFVSKTHGQIGFVDGGFCYTDRSTNGTLINGAKVSMSWNEAVRFADGDTMTLGEVQIAVQVIESSDTAHQKTSWANLKSRHANKHENEQGAKRSPALMRLSKTIQTPIQTAIQAPGA